MLHSWNLSPEQAIALQKRLASRVILKPLPEEITVVAGADVGYSRGHDRAVAAVATYTYPGLELRELVRFQGKFSYPYVSGLLSFREIPLLLQAFEHLREEPDVVRNPLSGSSFMAAPVPKHAVEKMTTALFDRMVAEKKYDLISPGHVKGRLERLANSDNNIGMDVATVLKKVGETFGADAVMLGYVYRWSEREGSDYAAKKPASVAFDLYIVRPFTGEIIWGARYDKTQRPLSENILDWSTFAESGGRWMTAEKMAMLGLEKMFKEIQVGQLREDQ